MSKSSDPVPLIGGKTALLANARPDKGFDLVLQIARRCPDIAFIAIASQSDPELARLAVAEAKLENVQVRKRTDRMDELYQAVDVVLVPSYDFRETFSRVCIEAHRHGLPVIGSDTGNVPYLLAQSGIILPRDVQAWADELKRLVSDTDYYGKRRSLALANSARYDQELQRKAFDQIVSFVDDPMLVGVGSGIGDMLHTGPMIANIARQRRAPVDLVVSEDHLNSLFLLHNPRYVNAVYPIGRAVLERPYKNVLLTRCFGEIEYGFNTPNLQRTRNWGTFEPERGEHQAVYNLRCAQELMGFDFHPEDANHYFLSDIEYKAPNTRVVGIHAGSKDGFWETKRWPHFSGLTDAILDRGFEVRSFGLPGEYVPGTRDYTGGSLEEMAHALCGCDYFVSNDSGVMNMANALGIPLLALFGPTDPKIRRPIKSHSVVVMVEKDCAPCEFRNRDRYTSGKCRCMAELSPDTVIQGFDRLLGMGTDRREGSA